VEARLEEEMESEEEAEAESVDKTESEEEAGSKEDEELDSAKIGMQTLLWRKRSSDISSLLLWLSSSSSSWNQMTRGLCSSLS